MNPTRFALSFLTLFLLASLTSAAEEKKWPIYTWPTEPTNPADAPLKDRQVIRLYTRTPDDDADTRSSLETPGMQVFLPTENPTGKAILLIPGGSYHHITASKIFTIAEQLRKQGATVFVLFYRYGTANPCPIPLNDGARAVRILRTYAKPWKLDPQKITVIGLSAAGHLAGYLATTGDIGDAASKDPIEHQSSRPNLVALISPVISMREDWAGTRTNTLPKDADVKAFGEKYSIDALVDKSTPPTFLWHANDDSAVKAAPNSDALAAALKKANIPVEYVNAEKGGHVGAWSDAWGKPLTEWLQKNAILNK